MFDQECMLAAMETVDDLDTATQSINNLSADIAKVTELKAADGESPPTTMVDFEQSENGKNLICFACGYDKNALNDKICKNCGTELN